MEKFINQLKRTPLGELICHHQRIPAKPSQWRETAEPLPDILSKTLHSKGIKKLYVHQGEALDFIRQGEQVIISTPTASGKTLIYLLSSLEKLLQDPAARSLYLFPIKALEQDQRKAIEEWTPFLPLGIKALSAIYDGDTPVSQRKKIRQSPPPILISNPDMLHLGILSFHEQWKEFFQNLRLVVLDEAHTYKGVLGSHVVQVIRRLRRLCALYGSAPQFILCSATIARPEVFSQSLTGLPFQVVQESGFPSPGKHFIFLNPDISPSVIGARLFTYAITKGKKTILFTRSRKVTELIHMWVEQMVPALRGKISSYRAGFLPQERREIERRLASGELLGVISTSALEMGIDIGSLDVCLLVGYPGSIINTWQRSGRVGRSRQDSAIILIAQADALDQYFIRHPEDFFGRGFETAVVDPDNAFILKAHLTCAAAELPLHRSDIFFNTYRHLRELKELEKEGRLLLSARGEEWISSKRNPHREVNIRSIGEAFTILTAEKGEIVGTLDRLRAFKECHPGAIYLHKAESFLVTNLDLFEKNVYVTKKEVNFYTRIVAQKETEIIEKEKIRPVGNFLLNFGKVLVTETFTGYEKRAIHGQELLGNYPLELPPQTFETEGLWIEIEDLIQDQMKAHNFHIMGGLHALEHGAITIFPLFALCDRGDVGGICYPRHPQVGKGAIFIYDGYPGGVGLARRGYEIIENLLDKTIQLIAECPCEEGCPSCIHSPQCGSGNKPLDKEAALYLARILLGKTPLQQTGKPLSSLEEIVSRQRPEAAASRPVRLGFFDLETQRLAEEVGGWGNKHLMRLSVGVVYDSQDGRFHEYREEAVTQLVEHLKKFDLLVGFNIKDFDFQVLSAYTAFNFSSLPTVDLLEDVFECLGFRLSLDHIAHKTLGAQKSGNGLQAVQWFREDNWEELTAYCRKDVELTKQVFEYGREKGYLLFESKGAQVVRCPVDWGQERIESILKNR